MHIFLVIDRACWYYCNKILISLFQLHILNTTANAYIPKDPCIMTIWSKGGPVKVTFRSIEQKWTNPSGEKALCGDFVGESNHTILYHKNLRLLEKFCLSFLTFWASQHSEISLSVSCIVLFFFYWLMAQLFFPVLFKQSWLIVILDK